MKDNIHYIIACDYDDRHYTQFLHIGKNNRPYFMIGVYIDEFKCYKSLRCAIKKAKEIKPLFPKYRNIAVLKVIDGQITSDSIVELF